MRRVRTSWAWVVFGGVVTATALFVLTSWTPEYTFLGPLCATRTVVHPGFDLWTGQPHGRTYDCAPIDGSATTRITAPVPDDLIDRRAIPLPIGFALGAFIVLVWPRSGRWWIVVERRTSRHRACN
jgi:hypothetical protein